MKRELWYLLRLLPVFLLLFPTGAGSQPVPARSEPPAIEQPLVREGTFAVRLESVLAVGTSGDEVEAETSLATVGIIPRNGWMADYPVTPDIVAELQETVRAAADAGKLPIGRDEAVKRFTAAAGELGLAITPSAAGKPSDKEATDAATYPDPVEITDYYADEGPPVVTYYTPPPDYFYLYSWVPYPFWCADVWFPGFFVLRDFHRVSIIDRRVVVISNHFNDVRRGRAFRVDPVARFSGRTFAGIGAPRTRSFIPTGVQRSDRVIFNGPRSGLRQPAPPAAAGRVPAAPRRSEPMLAPRFDVERPASRPPAVERAPSFERAPMLSPGGDGGGRGGFRERGERR